MGRRDMNPTYQEVLPRMSRYVTECPYMHILHCMRQIRWCYPCLGDLDFL